MTNENTQPMENMARFAEQWKHALPGLEPGVFMVIGSLLRLAQMVDNEFRNYTQSNFQMGVGDMRILLALRRAGDSFALRPTDLFRSLLITSGAVTKQIERLTQRGLVDRISDPKRKRGWQIHLTAEGKKVTDMTLDAIYNVFNVSAAFRSLAPAEREAGNLFLLKLISQYESEETQAGAPDSGHAGATPMEPR